MRIGIAGPDGSGKSALAKAINEITGATLSNFAYAVRFEVSRENSISMAELLKKPTPESIRQLLRKKGRDRRTEDKDYWVKELIPTLKNLSTWVVDDCRYDNEAAMLKSLGGIIVYLKSPYKNIDDSFSELHLVKEQADIVYKAKLWSPLEMARSITIHGY